MDSWTTSRVPASATIIRTMALTRSSQGARLKSSHQRRMNTDATIAPNMP
jgi:hypothetical protein